MVKGSKRPSSRKGILRKQNADVTWREERGKKLLQYKSASLILSRSEHFALSGTENFLFSFGNHGEHIQ